jgi:hypothetical protein
MTKNKGSQEIMKPSIYCYVGLSLILASAFAGPSGIVTGGLGVILVGVGVWLSHFELPGDD